MSRYEMKMICRHLVVVIYSKSSTLPRQSRSVFRPGIHNVCWSQHSTEVHFIVQNKWKCQTGKKLTNDVNRSVPMTALLKRLVLQRIDKSKRLTTRRTEPSTQKAMKARIQWAAGLQLVKRLIQIQSSCTLFADFTLKQEKCPQGLKRACKRSLTTEWARLCRSFGYYFLQIRNASYSQSQLPEISWGPITPPSVLCTPHRTREGVI